MHSFSMTIGPIPNNTKQKKIEKIMQCPFINLLLFDMVVVFSFFLNIILHLLLNKGNKT
jgi:hypothetical protein